MVACSDRGSFAASGCGCHDGNLWSSERVRQRGHRNASRSCAGSINELLGSARRRDNHSRLGGASNRCRRGFTTALPGGVCTAQNNCPA